MAGETHGFIRMPPDSSGKRVTHSVLLEVSLKNVTNEPNVGEKCKFNTSGLVGVISEAKDKGGNLWNIHVSLKEPILDGILPTINEDFLENDIKIGEVATQGNVFYTQQNVIAGGINNVNLLDIDSAGSASVRFTEGSPQFDAFGKLQTSEQTSLGDYTFAYDLDEVKWNNILTGAGSIGHNSTAQCMVMSVGTGSTDTSKRITHNYHHYHLGTSQLASIVVQFGDSGKTGNKRTFGYGDDDNGIFFCLNEQEFGILERSSSSGTLVENFIPKSQWNSDRLDGSKGVFNQSGIALDLTKINSYWIDIQWMGGSGRVRFGVFVDGKRIICHQQNHSNRLILPFVPTASLPLFIENRNTTTTSSSSELRMWAATVRCEGKYDPTYRHFSAVMPPITLNSTNWTYLFGFRPAQTYKGKVNRISGYGQESSIYSTSLPFRLAVFKNPIITGANWSSMNPESAIEGDMSASSFSGGTIIRSAVLSPGSSQRLDMASVFNLRGEVLRLHQDGVTQNSYVFAGQLLAAGTTDIYFTPFWKEI